MKSLSATLRLAGFVLTLVFFCKTMPAQQGPDDIEGNWTIYSTSIETGETVVKHVQIAQYGNSVTGYFEGPNQSGPIQGSVNAHHVEFSTVTRNVLTFRGQIYGNNMSGTYGLHGKHAPWQAMRTSGGPVEVAPAVSYSQPVLTPPAPAAPGYMPTPVTVPQTATYSATTSAPPSNPAPIPAALSSDQLDALVAPIALYPDALVAQVLAASTNPDQVAYADDWLAQNRNLTGPALEQATDQQSWDPSVKALTQFPSVLDNLAHNLSWTSSLGQAFANQQSDVMMAVQVMRGKAQAAGTLQSNSQITVTQPAANTIVIQPANPQVVYVPEYNPTLVYGAPVVVPMYVAPPLPVASVGLYFGTGITIGAAFGGGGWGGGIGWGWHAWNVNWGGWGGGGGSTIIFNHNTYINNHTWNNTNYNGYHPWGGGAAGSQNQAWYGANGTFHPDGNYKPGEDTHYGPNGGYHPNGYFGPDGGWHADKGTGPNTPNGGNNGNHGLIGGNGGVQNRNAGMNGPGVAPPGGYHKDGRQGGTYLGASNERSNARNLGSSRMSGDGPRSRMESNRGRESMAGRRPQQHMAREHAPAEHHFGGGGGRRR